MPVPWLDSDTINFPSTTKALTEPNGLLAAGGGLSIEWLTEAYRRGIFPWYQSGQPILWWSPDPRLTLTPASFVASRSLRKLIRKHRYQILFDTNFMKNRCILIIIRVRKLIEDFMYQYSSELKDFRRNLMTFVRI